MRDGKSAFTSGQSTPSDVELKIICRVFAWLHRDHLFRWGHSKHILAIFEYDLSFRVKQNFIVVIVGIAQAVPVQWVTIFLKNDRLVCFDFFAQEGERVHRNGDEICDLHHRWPSHSFKQDFKYGSIVCRLVRSGNIDLHIHG